MKAVFSYLVVLLSAFLYMLLFDRDAGGIMTVFLIVVPLVSVFLTLFARKKVSFFIEVSEDILAKNKPYHLVVRASKSTFLPLPVVSFAFSASEHFRKPDFDAYRFSMSENREISLKIDLLPEVCGTAVVSAEKMYITDYLGIFRFRMPVPEVSETVCIMAEIHELNDYSELLSSIYSTLPDNDDDNETAPAFGKTALPGYSYRNYIPGDSLKKINWKLSSKKNELYVRTDESAGITQPEIILDINTFGADISRRSGIYNLGLIIEGSLSVLNMCVKNGIESKYSYPRNGVMHTEMVSSPEDVQRISCEMMNYLTGPCSITLESDSGSKSSDVSIICTLHISEELAVASENAVSDGNSVKFIVPDSLNHENTADVQELWTLGDDWNLSRIV